MTEKRSEKKPNILSPTLRAKKRYIAYEIISEREIAFEELVQAFWFACMQFLGEVGTAKASLWIPKDLYNTGSHRGLMKCAHTEVENVRASLALLDRIGDSRVIVNVLGVTGTMKSARSRYGVGGKEEN